MDEEKVQMKKVLLEVYESLDKAKYDPVSQIVGYLQSGDPGYVSTFEDARNKIISLDRNLLIEIMLKEFITK